VAGAFATVRLHELESIVGGSALSRCAVKAVALATWGGWSGDVKVCACFERVCQDPNSGPGFLPRMHLEGK
jgi:hypothetical protein